MSGLAYRYGANAHLIRYADDVVIVVGKDVNKAMEKLQEIISSMGLELSTEKTRIVKANEGFDFLGFHFTRVYSHRRRRNVIRWFPSEKAENSIRRRMREVTERSRLATTLPDEAREILMPILRGWGNYFAYGTVSSKVRSIFYYAEASLMRMYCNQHHTPARWEYCDVKLRHLSVMEYIPETLMANGYKSYCEGSR